MARMPPLTEDDLVLDVDGNPGLRAALERWTATTADALWPEQYFWWIRLVDLVEGRASGMTPKDGDPPMLRAFSDLAHELWRVGKARKPQPSPVP